MKKRRLDEVLIERGLARDKSNAFIVVTEGRVFVAGQKAVSPAQPIAPEASVEMKKGREFVGRGAYKLRAGLERFSISANGKICADIGAATGGFTEVLLNKGAKKVFAIDTAKGKLDPKLREDPRVIVMEGVDARDIETLPEPVECVSIDVSLLSLEQILPHLKRFISKNADIVALLKPQYQTRDRKILKRGIVKDDKTRQEIAGNFFEWAKDSGWTVEDWMESPIKGGEGNVEFLMHLKIADKQ